MGDRATNFPQTQVLKGKIFPLVLQGAGSGKAPVMKYGDPNAAFFTQPAFVSTGIWTIQTIDGWPQWVLCLPSVMQATGAGTTTIQLSPVPAQITTSTATNNANSWKFTLNTFTSSSAADLLVGDQAIILFMFDNSSLAT